MATQAAIAVPNGSANANSSSIVETDLLIVGAGPAGASLACFLAQNVLKGIMLASTPSTADTPRAHITNMAALECLRDIGLEEECLQVAVKGDSMLHTRWCRSMAGEEFARIYSWGNDPARAGDYDATYQIRSKYLFGCDGARSQVLRQLKIPLKKKPGQGLAINVLVKVNLEHVVENRMGNLHWVMRPDEEYHNFGWTAIVRMVKPWNEWMFILFPKPGAGVEFNPTPEEYLECIKTMVGDDSLPVEILGISKWFINEIVAEYYSDSNIFCLGDAVHRHPPLNGLGSNTCIQDAYNLAWKIAYVMKGKASRSLLDSYSVERQPVGESVITRANQGLRDHIPVWEALGMMDESLEVRRKEFAELSEASPAGIKRRAKLQEAIAGTSHEFHGVGVEMNQRYDSRAIFLEDEGPRPPLPEDAVLEHEITTYPGSRLPHAWLNTKLPGKQFSTIDLAGHGTFCLLTGIGGDAWKMAATDAADVLGIEVKAYSIGWRQDYEDVYFDWARRREISEDGCVLIRPDRFVAWRSKGMIQGAQQKLLHVLKTILGK